MGTVPSPLLEADYRDFSGSRNRSFSDPRRASDPRVKLLCSFGGKILPRPSDGRLRYVGGDTRMISVSRYIQFHALQSKMAEIYGPLLVMKYQLPEEDLDALVTVSSDEDVENMMDECDRLDSNDGTSRKMLRVFVFTSPDGDAIDLNELGDPKTSEQQYVDAINTLQMDAPVRRNDGVLSSYSPRNSDRLIYGASMIDRQPHALPSRNPTNFRNFPTLNDAIGALSRQFSDSPQFSSDFHSSAAVLPVGGAPGADFRERLSGGSATSSTSSQYDHHQVSVHKWNAPSDIPSPGGSPLQGAKKDISNQSDIGNFTNFALRVPPVERKDHVSDMSALLSNDLLTEVDGARKSKVELYENSSQDPGAILQRQLEADRDQNSVVYDEGMLSLMNNGTRNPPLGVQDPINNVLVPNESSNHFPTISNSSNTQPNLLDEFIPDVSPLISVTDSGHPTPLIEQAELAENLHAPPQQTHARGNSGHRSVVFSQVKNTGTMRELAASVAQGPFNPDISSAVLLQNRIQGNVDHGIAHNHMFQIAMPNENNQPTPSLASLSFPNLTQGLEEAFPDLERILEQPLSTSMKNYNATAVPSSSFDDSASNPGDLSRKDASPIALTWDPSTEILPTSDLSSSGLHKDVLSIVKGREMLDVLSKNSLKVSVEPQNLLSPDEILESAEVIIRLDEMNGSGTCEEPLPPPPFHAPDSLIDVWSTTMSAKDDDETSLNDDAENFQSAIDRTVKSEVDDPVNTAVAARTEAIALGLQKIRHCDLEELRELGSGTFGTVYHGKWKGTDVAIKRIKSVCFTGRPSERDRLIADFWQEASILGQLHHPNVVAFYGIVPDGPDGTLATVTEFMVNGSLKQALQKKDRILDRRKRLLIAMDAAFGMEYLHGKKIVHFDLKCENLLVNLRDVQRPICKVGDLGLSKIKQQTMISGGVRGTLPWMAPELLNGRSILVSEKVDVFSFGVVLWELLTGEEPYADMHYGEIIGGIISNTLRPPIPTGCDPKYKALMEACWSADPAERPTFSDIARGLRNMETELAAKGRVQTGQA